jgi:hypothetical protein
VVVDNCSSTVKIIEDVHLHYKPPYLFMYAMV